MPPAELQAFLGWVAPIASTVIVTALTSQIKARQDDAERKRDEARSETEAKRRAEAEWRERADRRLDEQDRKIDVVLELQCSQTRSDLVHRAHRYIDDLHAASTEEKQAFWAQYEDYQRICEVNGIENHFIDNLAEQVMALPTRDIGG